MNVQNFFKNIIFSLSHKMLKFLIQNPKKSIDISLWFCTVYFMGPTKRSEFMATIKLTWTWTEIWQLNFSRNYRWKGSGRVIEIKTFCGSRGLNCSIIIFDSRRQFEFFSEMNVQENSNEQFKMIRDDSGWFKTIIWFRLHQF